MDDPLHLGDARDLSGLGLVPETVRCTITSPPYWDLKHYAEGDPREVGRGQTMDEYLATVRSVLEQVHDLTREDGVMWLVVDTMRDRSSRAAGLTEILPLPFVLADQAREVGWRFQDIVIWRKNKTLPYSGQGKLRNLIEYVLFFTRSGDFVHRPYRCAERHRPDAEWLAGWPERYHPLGRRPSNVWKYDIGTQGMWDHSEGRHACPFPQGLVAQILELTTDKGDIVLDPFAGIGTVVAQAIAMGRQGVGMELHPANVQTFHEHVLPDFQARWESGAQERRLAREDQRREAELIMRLRLLKAGKELLRAVQRLANARNADHPAAHVNSVVVLASPDLAADIDVDGGTVCRAGGDLILVGDLASDAKDALMEEVRPWLAAPPFTTFGIHLEIDALTLDELRERTPVDDLSEFGLSRHGAFTSEPDGRLFEAGPQLLTDLVLASPVSGDKVTELERARKRGERQLLVAELRAGHPMDVMAQRIGASQAELRRLLIEHGLLDPPKSFGVSISLPGQLALDEDAKAEPSPLP